jgi:hypothetical protein
MGSAGALACAGLAKCTQPGVAVLLEGRSRLLNALGARFGIHEDIKNGEDVAAVIEHARENVAERRIAFRFAVPLDQNRRRNFDVASQFLRGMPAQEQAVEKRGLALREIEVVPRFVVRSGGRHNGRIGDRLHKTKKTVQRRKGILPEVSTASRGWAEN